MVNIMKFFLGLSSVDNLAVILDKENKEMFDKILELTDNTSENRSIVDTCGYAMYIGYKI